MAAARAQAVNALEGLIVHGVGHSTRSFEDFAALLETHRIAAIADVRKLPGSRRLPQFDAERLAPALAARGIEYHWIPELGGRRRLPRPAPPSTWRNASFQAYAQHLQSPEFERGAEALRALAQRAPTAMMCAEALWWQCHRSLIADWLKDRGATVLHLDAQGAQEHPWTSAARIVDGRLSYAPVERDLFGG